jgi:hypothetical protein
MLLLAGRLLRRKATGSRRPDESGVSEGYRFAKCIEESQLVAIRSSAEFELEWLQMLGGLYRKPVIPVGLFPPPPTQDIGGHKAALQWLDRQARGSVVYARQS